MTFPRIDSPCPLSPDEQRRIEGDCDRCGKHVQRLERLDPDGRRAWMAAQGGPVCVSYRVARRRGRMAGLAIAATLVTATTIAAAAEAPPAPPVQSTAPASADTPALETLPPGTDDAGSPEHLFEFVIVGGVHDPAAAEWIDPADLPELPVEVEVEVEGTSAPASPTR